VNEKSEIREQAKAALKRLSPAQRKVFDAMLKGGDAPAIAERVGVTPSTVSSHIVAILKEFGVSSRIDLLAMFVVPPPRFKGRPHKYNRKSVGEREA
jgi:DNA-binding NarL/FixJ family response regulator